ncbi:ABC transporter substrate-binding protein [Haliea sp. E1-2-M8]|uniref:MlaC/ttg2D family ABC transporter substrate-binding protein n=1 Tax=Haliea sp. E1-2-M8 TaxID=3064706 RepID=UPI00272560BA|nr:ABC transporter substrate-binding protein [Haliea sp. E1-2-M8]MDO8861367.1 ABC transporter substrate-binding protein [Haliea sp. E1-2-M8]
MKRLLQFAASLVLAGAATMANAVDTSVDTNPPEGVHEVVREATEEVMSVVDEAQTYVADDPDRFYDQLQEILDTVVDFRGFARGVMGPYASNQRYRSLDAEGREELRDQLERFTEVMRVGLVRTYGKGLLAFGGSRIELPELSEEEAAGSRAAVRQLIFNDGSEPYVLVYHMGRDKDGSWKLRNMVIENVNLGEIYRSQFESAARKHDGDLDQVIEGWTAVEIET